MSPAEIRIRMYQVGFGDCFLLTFRYAAPVQDRHVLIDFGTTAAPKGVKPGLLKRVATDIAETVGKEPLAVVATHRHADHIAGFDPGVNGKGPGAIIAALKPKFVVQPWTEDPKLPTDAVAPPGKRGMARRRFSLEKLHRISEQVLYQIVPRLQRDVATKQYVAELAFLGEDNLKNPAAVKQLIKMAPNEYVYAGKPTRLSRFLPGVKVKVLGPPTVEQHAGVKRQRQKDPDEFWALRSRAFALEQGSGSAADHGVLFPKSGSRRGRFAPEWARWLVRRQRVEHAEGMLQLVRSLDSAMNNTSVILLFECGRQKLLFPGDAQIENWEYTLSDETRMAELKDVTAYKVGHHGSLNATPISLWREWFPKGTKSPAVGKRMVSLLSTMEGKHGNAEDATEVPRQRLVNVLKNHTRLCSTQQLGDKPYSEEVLRV